MFDLKRGGVYMVKRVHVIATFNLDGRVRPLWLRLKLEEDAPVYKICDCRCKDDGNWSGVLSFWCVISNNRDQHEIRLDFHTKDHIWNLVLNNSNMSFGA